MQEELNKIKFLLSDKGEFSHNYHQKWYKNSTKTVQKQYKNGTKWCKNEHVFARINQIGANHDTDTRKVFSHRYRKHHLPF